MIDLEMLDKQLDVRNKLEEMFTMQKALNENILKIYGENVMTKEKLKMAIFDELGELTHELKGNWCWWKKTQKPVNRQRVLEELVDVYHFVMTWEMKYANYFNEKEGNSIKEILEFYLEDLDMFNLDYYDLLYSSIDEQIINVSADNNKLDCLCGLTVILGFTFDEVYQEYLKKNKENYKRLKEGY